LLRLRQQCIRAGVGPACTVIEARAVGVERMRLEVDAAAVVPDDGWSTETVDR
jgi:hypothetical protein